MFECRGRLIAIRFAQTTVSRVVAIHCVRETKSSERRVSHLRVTGNAIRSVRRVRGNPISFYSELSSSGGCVRRPYRKRPNSTWNGDGATSRTAILFRPTACTRDDFREIPIRFRNARAITSHKPRLARSHTTVDIQLSPTL